jgi:hypothetical protein
MALHRGIGVTRRISPGRTHLWEITYPNAANVGVVVAAPNLGFEILLGNEIVALEQGVVDRDPPAGHQTRRFHYTVKIRNNGPLSSDYNLNIGDWLPEGSPAPAVRFIRQLPLPGDIHVDLEPVVLAKKKRRGSAARKRKASRRR